LRDAVEEADDDLARGLEVAVRQAQAQVEVQSAVVWSDPEADVHDGL